MEKADRSYSKIVYFFQAVFLLLAVIAASKLNAGVLGFTLAVLFVWWAGLAIFAAHPFGGEFRFERRLAMNFIQSRRTNSSKLVARFSFFVLYWPVFISKDFYFFAIFVAAAIYYTSKYF